METEIYYFSGTGNSLAVARDVAEKTNGKLIPISSVMDRKSLIPDADTIGVVFPVHFVFNGGIPFIIERFVGKLHKIEKKYMFAVCVCGNGAGDTIKNMNKALMNCGGRLAAGFIVEMPYNYILFDKLSEVAGDKQQKMFNNWKKKVEVVSEYVNAKKEGALETSNGITLLLVDLLGLRKFGKSYYGKKAGFMESADLPFYEILPWMDRNFTYDEKCNGCGICSKLCPVGNLEMVDERPSWRHHCEQCFACLQWCPKEAIQFGDKTSKGKRYHHPDVKISDLLRQN